MSVELDTPPTRAPAGSRVRPQEAGPLQEPECEVW